jgi:hypothetical protein
MHCQEHGNIGESFVSMKGASNTPTYHFCIHCLIDTLMRCGLKQCSFSPLERQPMTDNQAMREASRLWAEDCPETKIPFSAVTGPIRDYYIIKAAIATLQPEIDAAESVALHKQDQIIDMQIEIERRDKALVEARDKLVAVLCAPEGNACIEGSAGDMDVINEALATINAIVGGKA